MKTRMLRLALVLVSAACSAGAIAAEPVLPELRLVYSASWKGISLGEVTITLQRATEPDCYQYESSSNPVGLVRMFYGSPRERSEFCVRDGRVLPRQFTFTSGKDADENYTLRFDLAAGKVTDHAGRVRDIPPNAQDRFGIQQAVRLWVLQQATAPEAAAGATAEFAQVDDRRIRHYRFAVTAHEKVKVPAGTFETLLVQRIDDPRRASKFWIAPERHHMPVKVETLRDGSTDLRMELRSAN